MEDAGQVDGDDPVPLFGRIVPGLAARQVDAGGIHREIEPAEMVDTSRDRLCDAGKSGDVGFQRQHLCLAERRGKLVEPRPVAVGEDEACAEIGQAPGGRRADAGGGAGDESDLAREGRGIEEEWGHGPACLGPAYL